MTQDAESWGTVDHPWLGLSIDLPDSLDVALNDAPADAVVAVEPDSGSWMPSSLVVTVEEPGADDGWGDRSRDLLLSALPHAVLVDDRPRVLDDGTPARNLVTHHVHPDGGATVLDQLLVVHRGRGVVVTCTTPALWHADRIGAFRRAQTSLRLPDEWAAT